MPTHVVQQGECLSSIARGSGLPSWSVIYDAPENAAFRDARPNPNVIFPGDQLFVPDIETRTEDRATTRRHRFEIKTEPTLLRIVVLDRWLEPVSGSPWRLEVGSDLAEGVTGGDGLVEHPIPPDAESALLEATVDMDKGTRMSWTLVLGALDPWGSDSGAQARLNNLGFPCGRVDGIVGPHTRAATKRFQTAFRLTVDGIPGPITKRKLLDVHGC